MADLSCKYLGLTLKNPVIVAACGLTAAADGVRKAAEAGAGAIVLKSLFEEQIRSDLSGIDDTARNYPESAHILMEKMGVYGSAQEYVKLIKEAKAAAGSVPVIASINCIKTEFWVDFAQQAEAAGADAVELNISFFPNSAKTSSAELEDAAVNIVKKVSAKTKIPLAVKLGPYYTNPASIVDRLTRAGAMAVILFNRFYRLDFNLDTMTLKAGPVRSSGNEYHESLRCIANLYGLVGAELVGATGIHDAETAIKFIAAGAAAVEVCSMLYGNGGWQALTKLVEDMGNRMDAIKAGPISSFRGKLSSRYTMENDKYERLQYIKALTGIS